MPSSNTQKMTAITTAIRKMQKQYFKFPQGRKYLHHSTLEFGKYEQKYMTCPIQTYASGSSHARKTPEEAGVHKTPTRRRGRRWRRSSARRRDGALARAKTQTKRIGEACYRIWFSEAQELSKKPDEENRRSFLVIGLGFWK